MSNVLTFAPRSSVGVPAEPGTMAEAEIRTRLGEALQTALDAADHIIAVLDRMEGEIDAENSTDDELTRVAPEGRRDSQVVWLRGGDADREAETVEVVLPEVAAGRPVMPLAPLPWRGSGNILAAAGAALFDIVAGCQR